MHVGHDVGGAVEARGGAMHFFCTQFVGIVIEDAVQALFRREQARKSKGAKAERETEGVASWKKWMGRVWVPAFLVWSTPTLQYPVMLAKRKTGDEMFPFSVAKLWYES